MMKRFFTGSLVVLFVMSGAALAHVAKHRAAMTGQKIVPGPGDPDGRARAVIRSSSEAETVCYKISFDGVRKPTAGHIHAGTAGTSGEKIVKLFASRRGKSTPIEGCKHGIEPDVIERFHDDPRAHYVDLHNERYPDGAVRGQLRNVE